MGHMAETRIITGHIGFPQELTDFFLKTLYYQPFLRLIVSLKRIEKSCGKSISGNNGYVFVLMP
jgi:hypothetical protein